MPNPALATASAVVAGVALLIPMQQGASATPRPPELRAPSNVVAGHPDNVGVRDFDKTPQVDRDGSHTVHPPTFQGLPERGHGDGRGNLPAIFKSSLDGNRIQIYLDRENFDMHITCEPGYSSELLGRALDRLAWHGYEVLDEEETPVELMDDGSVRLYLAIADWDEAA